MPAQRDLIIIKIKESSKLECLLGTCCGTCLGEEEDLSVLFSSGQYDL